MRAGDGAGAERRLREGYDVLERMGERGFLSTTAGLLAQVVLDQGRIDEALRLAEVCRDAASDDDLFSQVLWRIGRAKAIAPPAAPAVGPPLALEAGALHQA